ncbi:MAG TPA: 30S ribosomal protein THX [Flammeovirgaceae bacterium]|nr:30S ribosomal protein THX [Flammeovirgaceae bacterium]
MGKGDRKTRRGKITKGTFGVRRPHKPKKNATVTAAPKAAAKPKARPKAKATKAKAAAEKAEK